MDQAVRHFDIRMTSAEDPAPMLEGSFVLDSIALRTPLLDLHRNLRLCRDAAA